MVSDMVRGVTGVELSVRDSKGAWAAQMQARESLRRVLEVAESRGIEVLPVKGIITGDFLYGDPAARPITDIDLRVRPRDVPRLRAAVRNRGWREIVYSRAYRNLVFDTGGWMVDVEAAVGPPGLCGLDVDTMIRRASRTTEPLGFLHLRPELHDHALLLCVNAFKDKMVNANSYALTDLERVTVCEEFRPEELIERVRASGVRTLTWFVADWLAENRGLAAWRVVRNGLGARPPRALYVSLLRRAIQRDSGALRTRVLARAASDSRRRQIVSLTRSFIWELEAWARRLEFHQSRC